MMFDFDSLEIMESDEMGWRCWDYMSTEGTTLKELLDNAVVFATDKDGGEAGERSLGDFDTKSYNTLETIIADAYLDYIKSKGE